ncbi:MAG: ATP-binding protein, partial [Lentisphaeria bacterium]|nr:ATP-binding protein [Lentisphaeria bacterium]
MPPCFRSIKCKIQLAIALTSTCILLLFAALLVFTQYTGMRRELVQNLRILARLSANNLTAPLVFNAPEEASDVLLALSAVPGLPVAAVLRPDGTVFVHQSFDGTPLPPRPALPGNGTDHAWRPDRIVVVAPIELAGQWRGTVWLDCGLDQFRARLREILSWCLYLYLMATALAVLVAWLLQRVMTRPILALAQAADRTIQEGPSSVRARKQANDEIGTLVDSFNHMLDHIARQNEQLRDRERCYRTLFAQAASAFLLEDEDRRVVEANQAAATLFNQSEANLVGKPTAELFTVGNLPGPDLGERQRIARTEARLSNGSTVPVELAVTGVSSGGKRFFLTSATDITDRLRAQELLVRSRDELQIQVNAATAELREANASLQREMDERRRLERQIMMAEKLKGLGHMAAGIAHDFNNLLQTILGNADFLLAESLTAEGSHCVREIRRAGRSAADLASQMLAYAGKNALRIAPLQVNDLILSMQPLFEAAVAKNARAVYELGKNLPLIDADEGQLRQVVMNLVTNAAEALPPEGGTYTIRTGIRHCDQEFLRRTLLHENLPTGRYLFLAVQDTGCGIDPTMIERIFDPFFSTKFAGRGLGLAGVLGIVRAHRAAIMVDSMPG